MNILFRDGSSKEKMQLINMIRDEISPELSIVICIETAEQYLDKKGNEILLDYYTILEGRYSVDLNLPPVDQNLLAQLSPYYADILKSIGRNGAFYYSYPEREELFLRLVRYWSWVLDEYKIDLFLGFAVPHFSFDIVIYYLCKVKKIKTLFTWHTSVAPYMHFVEDIDKIGQEVCKPYAAYLKEYIDTDIDLIPLNNDFQSNFDMHTQLGVDRAPFYMKGSKLTRVFLVIRGIFSYYKYLKGNKKNRLLALLLKYFKLIDGGNYIKKYNQSICKIDYGQQEEYIYVPLHLQPEATTCPLGGVYANQLLMIQMLSYHLPPGVWLYVKENPKQDNSERSISFLHELLKLKNVKLLSLKEDTYQLIENCIAVATVTGTAAWEALLREKAVIIFGKHLNRFAPSVFTIRNNNDCRKVMEQIFKKEKDDLLLKKIKIFMLAMNDMCFESKILSELTMKDEETVREDIRITNETISNKIIKLFENDLVDAGVKEYT